MEDSILKNHRLAFPKPFSQEENSNLDLFRQAVAKVDAKHVQNVQSARPERFTMSANGRWLEARGSNVNRARPKSFNMTDANYRELIRLMSFNPMQVYKIFEDLMDFFLGENSLSRQLAKIYSVDHNLIEIEIKRQALIVSARRDLIGATYLHADNDLSNNTEFYSGYIFPNPIVSTVSPPAHNAGVSQINISQDEELFPASGGVVCIGDYESSTFECLHYDDRVADVLNLSSPTQFVHQAGELVYLPEYIRGVECVLNQNIVAGQAYGQISTSNSSDFPDKVGVVWFDWHKKEHGEDDRVVYTARLNNSSITLNSNYIFQQSYPIGSRITLCAKKPRHDIKGTDYAFYLNGTGSLVDYISEVFAEVKAEGVRLKMDFV